MQPQTQAGNITTNTKFKIYSTLPEFSLTKIATCNCHVNVSAKIRYDMIPGEDLLT